MLYHSFPHPPSLIALILIEMPSWIMPNGCGGGTFGSPHVWMPSNEWVAAVQFRWLFIEDAGKCLQNGFCHEKGRAGDSFGRRGWGTFGAAMTIWVIGEERIVLLDSSHFRQPPQCNLFLSLIQSSEIQEGHLGRCTFPYPSVRPLI